MPFGNMTNLTACQIEFGKIHWMCIRYCDGILDCSECEKESYFDMFHFTLIIKVKLAKKFSTSFNLHQERWRFTWRELVFEGEGHDTCVNQRWNAKLIFTPLVEVDWSVISVICGCKETCSMRSDMCEYVSHHLDDWRWRNDITQFIPGAKKQGPKSKMKCEVNIHISSGGWLISNQCHMWCKETCSMRSDMCEYVFTPFWDDWRWRNDITQFIQVLNNMGLCWNLNFVQTF